MIIKSGGISAGDGRRITNYAVSAGDNERVAIIQNDNDQLLVADEFATLRGRKNGLLHIIISPDQELTVDELKATVEAIREEFAFNPNDPETLTLHQSKRSDGTTQMHFHYVRPAADSETGRTYKLFRSNAKDEAVSRLCELQFGHQLTSGPRNDFAELRLREMGKDELADKLATAFADQDAPKAAYRSEEHQQAKRQSFDLPALRQSLKELAALPRSDQPAALAELVDQQGLELQEAEETGRGRSRIMIKTPDGVKNHNANRTLKIPAAKVADLIHETMELLNDRRYEHTERPDLASGSAITDHQRTGEDSPIKPGDDSAHERLAEGISGDYQELTNEADELVAAANDLRSQAARFVSNRVGDLCSSDIEAPVDPSDPNLLKKLSAILKRQLDRTNAALKKAMLQGSRVASLPCP